VSAVDTQISDWFTLKVLATDEASIDIDVWQRYRAQLLKVKVQQRPRQTITSDRQCNEYFTNYNAKWQWAHNSCSIWCADRQTWDDMVNHNSALLSYSDSEHALIMYKTESVCLCLYVCSLFAETGHISRQISTKFGMRHAAIPRMVTSMAFYL